MVPYLETVKAPTSNNEAHPKTFLRSLKVGQSTVIKLNMVLDSAKPPLNEFELAKTFVGVSKSGSVSAPGPSQGLIMRQANL